MFTVKVSFICRHGRLLPCASLGALSCTPVEVMKSVVSKTYQQVHKMSINSLFLMFISTGLLRQPHHVSSADLYQTHRVLLKRGSILHTITSLSQKYSFTCAKGFSGLPIHRYTYFSTAIFVGTCHLHNTYHAPLP